MIERVLITGVNEGALVAPIFVQMQKDRRILLTPSLSELDITKPEQVIQFFEENEIYNIVNYAATTDLKSAEQDPAKCRRVNVEGVENLLSCAGEQGAFFVQISTNMVIDPGKKGPHSEKVMASKYFDELTVYGATKAEAENSVLRAGGAVVRIMSPVRRKPDNEGRNGFLWSLLGLYNAGRELRMIDDQNISITDVTEAAEAVGRILDRRRGGIYHVTSVDQTTPYQALKSFLESSGQEVDTTRLMPISLDDFIRNGNDPKRYPRDGGLIVSETQRRLDIRFSSCGEIINKLANNVRS